MPASDFSNRSGVGNLDLTRTRRGLTYRKRAESQSGTLAKTAMAVLAVVSDVHWLRLGVKAFAPFIHGPVALFHTNELAEATKWVNEWKHDADGEPAVDVEARLPTLEDKA